MLFLVSSGPLAGWWLRECPGKVYLPGVVAALDYLPARTVQLADDGTFTASAIGADGAVVGQAQVAAGSSLRVDCGAVVDGVPSVRLSGGTLAGYWLPLGSGVSVQ